MAPTEADRETAREWAERHGFLIPFDPPTVDQLAELVAAGRADERERSMASVRPLQTSRPPAGCRDPHLAWSTAIDAALSAIRKGE